MKRTIIIAASAVTLAAAGIAGSHYLSGQSPNAQLQMETASEIRQEKSEDSGRKKEDGSRPAKAATAHRTSSTPIQAAGTTTAYATLRYGSVGIPEGKTADNPEDNIFEINLSRTIPSDARVWLCYELQGADHSGAVAKSINDRPATGGYMATASDGWTHVREEIHPAWLHAGVNRILFTAPEGRSYSVRNLHVETASGPGQALTLSQTPVVYGDLAYVHGFVRNGVRTVKAGHTVLTLQDGEFEGIVPVSGSSLTLSATTASGKTLTASFPTLKKGKADYEHAFQTPAARTAGKHFAQGKADSLKNANGALLVDHGVMLAARKLTMRPLREMDLPALDFGMTNVTAEGEGVRFLPHGTHFTEKGATVRLKYDRTRIPSGYTEDDIRTYYFDNDTKHWVALERVKVDKQEACVVSRTTHFTDMINGVIQAPESPETEGFAPTMMNDIKAADPTAKINLITPPQANNRGTASLQYAFEMPPARNGMAPSLGIQYSSEGGSGWLGEGWSLSVPSITLDTRWGVPRYDMAGETETYLLSGSMLSTMDDKGQMGVAHRGDKMPRKADRQFYTRQGGDFSRIIRKGSSPSEYYWEVTDKQGVKYTYGGEGAVLKGTFTDVSGNTREVISEWKLRRVEETHGDFMEYVYEAADEDVRGGLKAKALYLKEVRAGNAGQEPHTVVTFEGGKTRQVKTNNARYGYLTSSNRLLEKVTVNFRGNVLRSYAFEYRNGAFNRELLAGVRHLDSNEQEVSFQKFSYYDDVQSDKGYVPFKDSQETWNTHNDGLDAGFVNPLQGMDMFSDKPSALGGTTSSSVGGSFYAGVGPDDQSTTTTTTGGGGFNYSNDQSRGLSTFVDLNGDGLPDKVYRENGALYYRSQLRNGVTGEISYGEPVKVKGITGFSSSSSNTYSGGTDVKAGWGPVAATVGEDHARTTTKTKEYFSDINGDGLIDLVSNSKVYFNHIEKDAQGNAVPTFTLNSADTPSPIIYDPAKIDVSVGAVDPEEQAEMLRISPMEDAVRVWVAPKAGTISISGSVSLVVPTGDYDKEAYKNSDGVRVAIQKGKSELWNKTITKGDETSYTAGVSLLSVKKGDRIYFRVQSGATEMSNGAFDEVLWHPVVTYTGPEEIMPNGYSTTIYKPEEGALYFASTSLNIAQGNQTVDISGKFTKPETTDDVTLIIWGSTDRKDVHGNDNPSYVEKQLYTRTFPWNESYNDDLAISLQNSEGLTNLRFVVSAESNVRWDAVKWSPVISYTDSTGTKQARPVCPDYTLFANHIANASSYLPSATDSTLYVKPLITFSNAVYNGKLTLTVKTPDRLLGKKSFAITDGVMVNDSISIRKSDIGSDKVWFELFSDDSQVGSAVSGVSVQVRYPSVIQPQTVAANLYAVDEPAGFGHLYRGWGGFVYNASENRYSRPIDESLLTLPQDEDAKVDPLTMPFTPLSTDLNKLDRWTGQREEIFITATNMGAARLTELDVVLTNPFENIGDVSGLAEEHLQGTGAAAVSQEMVSKSTVKQTGVVITYNDSKGSTTTKSMMIDLNGDGYPDIVAGGKIQYTNTLGGISGEVLSGIGTVVSENQSKGFALSSDAIVSVSNVVRHIAAGKASAANQESSNKAKGGIPVSASIPPSNEDWSTENFIDVNGDGLPDKIIAGNKVRLNFGYAFANPIDWDIDRIQGGKGQSFSTGASFNIGSSSFAGGFNFVTSKSGEEYNLTDINSDGLPDKVWKSGKNIMVAFNNGVGFDSPLVWKGAEALNESASTSEGSNVAFTVNITPKIIPIKISVNPGVSLSHSINRTNYTLQDVDGDGYLDIVESEKESELKVTRSAIGRTNMLKAVTNSLGGTFTLDYAHTAPTYGLPGGKWVMSSLTVDDGIHDDGPLMTTAFEYKDGKRDRHEREFLGFGEVITKNLDTEKENALYRKSVQKYDVSGYYTQGNLVNASVEDAAGKVYTETHNEYDGYYLTAKGDEYTFTAQPVLCSDRASAFVPLRYTANLQYEGAAQGMITSEAWNEYYLTGHHGELKSYRFSNKGKLGSKGDGKFDYQTSIRYTSNSSRNILGLPTDVTVTGGDGKVYHQVSAVYDTKYPNHLTRITQQLGNGEAVTDYRYDSFGNILQKTLPANAKGQRMWYKYRYEPEMNMYVERVEDAFGYRSEAGNFDYRYGIAKERRDLNNFYYETDVDDLGRITGVRGPNELATGVPYIIAFEYSPKAEFTANGITAPAYAVTKHYDIQHPDDDMETVTFVDGFGRPVQVKKDGVVTSASEGSVSDAQNVMIVSGRNVYDAFGRVAKAYYPVTEELGKRTDFNKAFDGVSPTVTVYDVLDRATEVTLPDESKTLTAYTTDAGSRALVTTVTDALGNKQATYTNGSGKTVMTRQLSGPDGEITTTFEYDGIDRLVRVTDTEGNVTTSVYDMGDRRTEVNHPASGITTFTYDALGNVLTKQTANLAKEGKSITYDYDYHRLTGINYPDHPENNVKYYYGRRNASQNRIGRLMLREDGTGAIEYFYGKMGEVTKTRRTLIVPNQAIATYVTQWTYDSHNRLLEMIYPDEEKVTYSYNLGGQLEKVRGYKSYGYDYVNRIGYDKFEQRTYLKYCNGAETFYTYEPARRRLQNLTVNAGGKSIMDNGYTYDAVSNVLSVANKAALPESGKAGGQMAHAYTYDALYRLASATGTYVGADSKTASYRLEMSYDNMHRIVSKKQHLTQQGVQFDGTLHVGYDLAYTYGKTEGKKFQLAEVKDANYRTEENPDSVAKVDNNHTYTYDANGNLVYVNTGRIKQDGTLDSTAAERKLRWDEENRLTASDDNGFVTNYWYDADGERTVKTSGEGEQLYVNSEFAGGRTNTAKFSLYVSPYLVANQGGRYTKHIYIGSQRIVSKIGDFASYGSDPRRIQYAGSETDGLSVNYKQKYSAQQQVIKDNYAIFEVPYNGTDNNDYVDGQGFCCDDGSPEAAQARALALENNFQDPDAYEKLQFYYHPDHLGSSSYITNLDGEVVQHIEYVPFGEVFIEERNSIWNTPYLFNAKEFDEETGLYYYGARYYDPRLSLWISVDPISNYDPLNSENYLDGEHNGGIYNYANLNSYIYCYQNPIKLVDPNGKQVDAVDFIPVIGSGRDICRGFRDGDIFTCGIGLLGLIADVATFGSGSVITGGIKTGIKAGIKTTVKQELKQTVKTETKITAKALTQGSKEGFKTVSELGIKNGMKTTSSKALELGQNFLGKGYREVSPGRYVSADGKRVFRMGDNDILGKHGGGPHVNLEILKPNPNKPGKMMVEQNYHIFITE